MFAPLEQASASIFPDEAVLVKEVDELINSAGRLKVLPPSAVSNPHPILSPLIWTLEPPTPYLDVCDSVIATCIR